MAQLTEPNQVGKREDLADLIAVADVKATPLTARIKKGKTPMNTLCEWQADDYADPSLDGVVDGVDVSSFENKAANRKKIQGRLQKVWRNPKVSDFAENVSDVAGVDGEMARAVRKTLEEIGRDIESVMCSDKDSQADNGTDEAYETRGLGSWISNSAQTDLPVDALYRTPAGSIDTTATDAANFTEGKMSAVLESIFTEVGSTKSYLGLVGPKLKRQISTLSHYATTGSTNTVSTARVFNQDAADKALLSCIDFYEGDFGTIELHPTLFNARDQATASQLRRGYILDMDMLEMAYARLPRVMPLEDQGGGPRAIVDAIFTLKVFNPLAFGKFAATSGDPS